MNEFLKITGITLIVLILALFVKQQRNEISILLVIASVCIVLIFASVTYLEPVLSFVKNLGDTIGLDQGMIRVLIKTTSIGIICEIVNLICTDAGFTTLGKTLKLASVFLILWIALPLMNELITLLNKVLSNV